MVTIPVKGIVTPNDMAEVYSWFGYDVVTPNDLSEALNNANGEDIILEINSPGGYVDAGSEMYTALKKYSGNITAQIVGQACSAASWIALAADRVEMSPTAQLMIHRASTGVDGNVDDVASALQSLNSLDSAFVDLYSKRSGMDKQDVYRMMCKTTWMNAKEAVNNGFADAIMFEENSAPAVINAYGIPVLSNQMITKLKNLLHDKSTENVAKPLPKENKENDSQLQKKLAILFGKEY